MPENNLKKFSSNYKLVLVKAANLAQVLNSTAIGPEIILYSLIAQKGCLGSEILNKLNLTEDKIKQNLSLTSAEIKNNILPQFDNAAKKIIEKSVVLAYNQNHVYIGTEHLLLAMIESQNAAIKKIFQKNISSPDYIKNQVQIIFNSTSRFNNFASSFNSLNKDEELNELYPASITETILDNFTIDLTNKNIQKNIDPVIGRDEEISRLIEILMRRTKNNPLILGDPGVGKTALVEGLAKKITKGEVPEILLDKKILMLDLPAIVAGTMFRGEFENRMKQIMQEIKKNDDLLIFIDEIHNIIGAGSTQGSLDAANILKPALARGEIRCIGATTYEEYKKHFEGDAALERRFQVIRVKEPSAAETMEILQGVKEYYENYHQVKIADSAIDAAVKLSHKYIPDRHLPDKALDLIDEASSKIKIKQKLDDLAWRLKEKERNLNEIKSLKEKAIAKENFRQALTFKKQEQQITEEIESLKGLIKNKRTNYPQVSQREICEVVAKITHLPVNELLLEERDKFLNLEQLLAGKIIGQPRALTILAAAIRRAKAGISEQNRPLGSFIFIGPSGTGKTYTAKILSQILFDNPEAFIKIDMSEYSEKFNISKLIGAPAGYVGYKESGKLTDAVKRNPNALVLFDEIEKAHPDIFNLLLQVLDDGYITDAIGKKVDFKNTIIIMTSNLGSDKINKIIGFDKDNAKDQELNLENEVKKFFRPEFVNRLDKIVIFNKLNQTDLSKIVEIELRNLVARLKKQAISLEIDNKVNKLLLETNFREEQGARFIKQNIEELVENPLAEKIFSNLKPAKAFKLKAVNNKLQIING